MIFLDRNESYWLLDQGLVEVASHVTERELSHYPDYAELETALAAYALVPKDHVLATPGSDAAIEHIARTYGFEGRPVLLPVPTFYGYESILERLGAKLVPVVYEMHNEEFVFPLEKTIDALRIHKPSILFLCNPNNPLGCPLSSNDVARLAAAARGSETLVVCDEAYFEYSLGNSFLQYLKELNNLIIIRTLSKAFGLAGARVGYVIATPARINALRAQLLPWPIAHGSVASSIALLKHSGIVAKRREKIMNYREQFAEELRQIAALRVYRSQTNFVLVRVPDATRVHNALIEKGIRVARGEPMSHVKEASHILKDTLRIAIPSPHDIPLVISAMSRILTM